MSTSLSQAVSRTRAVYTIAIIGFIYTLHLVIPMYSNSSFLSLFTDERTVGYIYMAGAAVTILGFLLAPPLIRRWGNYRFVLWMIVLQAILFYLLINSDSSFVISFAFIIETAVVSLIGLTLDIFLEVYTDSNSVGSVRGLYTATLNASWVIAPLIGSMLVNGTDNYRNTYIAGLAMLVPLFYLIHRNFPRFKDPGYTHLSPHQLIHHVAHNHNWIKLFSANIILQTFYAWMTIYTPIYLHTVMNFNWDQIGIILVIMLLPFPLIQYPLGILADKKYGEKEIMLIGFAFMGLASILLSYITTPSVLVWAVALALTRVGAASAEIMIETYFFKTVSPRDAAALGIFRITRPMSYFTGPLVGIIGMLFFSTQIMFTVVGIMTFFALIPIATIKDTN